MKKWLAVLAEAALPADHPELRDLERQITVKESTITDLKTKLKEADKGADLFHNLAAIIAETVEPLEALPSAWDGRGSGGEGRPVSMVSVFSDGHGDLVVHPDGSWGIEDFDFDIYCLRLERWAKIQADYICRHLPNYKFEDLWILGLGDDIHGDIHGNGPFNHFRNSMKAAIAVGDAQAEALAYIYGRTNVPIRVVRVSGNHPRRTVKKSYHGPQDNFDYLVGALAARRLQNIPEIEIIQPNSWTAFAEIRGRVWCLNHGDDVKGFAGHPWYGFDRKNNRVQALVNQAGSRVDYFVYGHFHNPADVSGSSYRSIHNGAFPATDPYAQESLSVATLPLQRSFVVDDELGIILELPIYLRDEVRERRFRSGETIPKFGRTTTLDLVKPEATKGGVNIIRRAG